MKNILFLNIFLGFFMGCDVETFMAEAPKEAAPQAEVLPVVEVEEVEPAPIEEPMIEEPLEEAVQPEPVVPKPQPSKLGKIVGYSALGVLGAVVLGLVASKVALKPGSRAGGVKKATHRPRRFTPTATSFLRNDPPITMTWTVSKEPQPGVFETFLASEDFNDLFEYYRSPVDRGPSALRVLHLNGPSFKYRLYADAEAVGFELQRLSRFQGRINRIESKKGFATHNWGDTLEVSMPPEEEPAWTSFLEGNVPGLVRVLGIKKVRIYNYTDAHKGVAEFIQKQCKDLLGQPIVPELIKGHRLVLE